MKKITKPVIEGVKKAILIYFKESKKYPHVFKKPSYSIVCCLLKILAKN